MLKKQLSTILKKKIKKYDTIKRLKSESNHILYMNHDNNTLLIVKHAERALETKQGP